MRKSLTAFVAVALIIGLSDPAGAAARSPAGPAAAMSPGVTSRPERPAAAAGPAEPRAPQAPAANPITGNPGFGVFVQGNAALNGTASGGPVAVGGNLSVGSGTFNVASQTAGTFTASGDSRPTGLLVGGSIDWTGAGTTGLLNVQSSSYVKVGDMTGSAVAQSGSAATHIVPAGHSYASLPQIAEVVNQPTASVNQTGLIDFTGAFSAFSAQSANLAGCAGTLVLTSANGTPLTFPLAPGTNAYVTLSPGTQNILNISAADLANISLLVFRNVPTATMPLVVNVDTSGVGGSFSWTPPNFNGFSGSAAAYLLWNFAAATQLTIGGSQTVPGTIYAPGASVSDLDASGLNGGVIAAAFTQGAASGSPSGGQVLSVPFAASLSSCTVTQLTISQSTAPATAVPGGTVTYTVSVNNTGNTAYTGATFTDPLSGVLDDASYNNDASATSGSVSFASPNLTWTGNLAAGASATITFSVTVSNPDTGNNILASTITSTTTGSNCASGSNDSRCTASVAVTILTIAATASPATTAPGATVSYTVTVTNSGQAAYTGAAFTDALAGMLDDASYNNNGSATAGSVSFASPNLTWTGNLAIGASATITFSVTVKNPDTGDKVLASTITSATAGSNCASGSTDSRCSTSVTVLVPGLTIALTADTGSTSPGSTVGYTISVTNTGQSAQTGATVTDSLSGVLNDASYNNDASATAGSVSFASPSLTWTGNLAVGASATITFSVTVKNPDTGGRVMVNKVTSATPGSNCPAGGTDPRCTSTVQVLVPGLSIVASANTASIAPGGTARYTVTVTNSGNTALSGATFTDPLADVLDDAAYNGDASATAGSVSFASPNLTWTGNLAAGASATITFSVTVSNPDTGNKILTSTITSTTPGSNCAAGSGDANCTATVNVAALAISNTSNVTTTTPGSVVRFTATFTNSGRVAYTGITIASNITDVLDDATPNGDQTATSGTLTLTATGISWTGSIPVGGTVTVTGTVTVNNPDTGNKLMASTLATSAAGSNCPPGGTDPACSVSVPVLNPALTISQTADTTAAVPGQTVTYTVTAANTGPVPYSGATVTDTLRDLDDSAYNNDAVASAGSVSFASPVLTWTGSLAVGATVTITFSMTVDNPDTGDKLLLTSVASADPGSNCPPGSGDPACNLTIPVLTPALTIVKTAATTSGDNAVATPGSTVSYTITVTNSGQVPYTGAAFTDPLGGVLDDASYNDDAAATAGSVSVASPDLSWTGDLAVGASATITYSVTVNDPDTGDQSLANTVTSATTGSNCPAGAGDARCTATVTVVTASVLTFTQTAADSSTVAGGTVNYTITIANSAAIPFTGASFTDPLTDVLDDATYNNDASASAGTVSFASPTLSWSGDVPANGAVTITYSVTVHDPDTGNKILTSTISSPSAGGNCPADTPAPNCTATVTVSQLAIDFAASTGSTTPGGTVGYTATLTNTGETPYLGISVSTDSTGISDDATGNGDESASSGTLTIGPTGAVWTGNIAVGQTVTVTSTATVNDPDTGDHVLTATAVSTAPGNNCPPGGTDPACTPVTDVLTPGLSISQTADTTSAVPGQTVTYTWTVANTGQTPYTGATVTDTLRDLDDAAYSNDAVASAGSVSYASPVLTWTGDLAVGATVTITFSVTVDNPDTGDKLLATTVASTDPGSSCPPDSPNPGCTLTIPVLTPALTIAMTATPAATTPGGTVSYTITVDNTGQTPYTGASVTDSLAGVLDDADYNGDAAATSGSADFSSPALTWTGDLAPGDTATISYTVTVHDPDTGDGVLASALTSAAAGSNCPDGSTDPRCASTVDVAALTIGNSASVSTATPGSVVAYTVTVQNPGQTSYTNVSVTDPLDGVLDDAAYNNDAVTTSGSVTFSSPELTWTGNLAPGDSATVAFSVTVDDPDTGDKTLASTVTSAAAGSNCPVSGGTDPRCTATVTVLVPALTITKTASVSTTTPGSTVGYTITVDNTGQTPYFGASVTDPLGGLLNDGPYNNDAAATSGTVSFASPVLTWTGDLNPGDTATITFSVTVSDPDTGDKLLVNTAVSADAGSNCLDGSTDPRCTSVVPVLVPALTITKTASVSTATPGSTVGYTITVDDTGQTPYTGAAVTDSLAGVLGDAAYNNDGAATSGTVSFASPVLTWTGDLNPGDTATISYSVTVSNPDTGGRVLANSAVSAAAGSTCPAGSADPACTATVSIVAGALSISVPGSAFLGSTDPGGTVSASLGTVEVTDNRGFGADWTATVTATDFTTGTATPAETVPVGDASYGISGLSQTTGSATFSTVPQTQLSTDPQAVVSATNVAGNTSATWEPLIDVTVPATAVGGPYTATVTHSVA